MATRYVGLGGNDGNSGLTWALRKLTLNGIEDTPVVAGDLIYAGPGVYREMLTVDVDGGAGTEIVYVGDVTGEHTDGVGGIVRITGSDNDQSAVRAQCIIANTKDHRTFRGFLFDTTTGNSVDAFDCEDWIIEDCAFLPPSTNHNLAIRGNAQLNFTIRRCFFKGYAGGFNIYIISPATQDDIGHVVENCLLISALVGVQISRVGGAEIDSCSFIGRHGFGVELAIALAVGQTANVNNSIFEGCSTALRSVVLGWLVENYNTFFSNSTDRINVNVGAQSVTYPALMLPPFLHAGASQASGFKFPWWFGELTEWSQVQAITGTNQPTIDMRGILRPVTASKKSWGCTQFFDAERETGTVRTGSVSIALHDAGRHQIFVPVTATSTTILVYVYREANYAGNLPQMIIKQPGQADDVTTDVGGAGGWNLLTTTLVPAADPPYVVVELVSRNTAVALAFKVFFDDLDVS